MNSPKILYVSCHSVLEYDELRMFRDAGLTFLSVGSYVDPAQPTDGSRLPLSGCSLVKDGKFLIRDLVDRNRYKGITDPIQRIRTFDNEFLDNFDVIVVMHVPNVLSQNWTALRGRKVVWRTIGQSVPDVERQLLEMRKEGLKIVRYSPMERRISGYLGEDAMIRFGKYKEDFKAWTGVNNQVITIGQAMKYRGWYCNYDTFVLSTAGFEAKIYGRQSDSEDVHLRGGEFRTYSDLIDTLAANALYFYTGTRPASYTLNFIEACMAGIPIVSIGSKLSDYLGEEYLEVPQLLEHYNAGFSSNEIYELRKIISKILDNRPAQEELSVNVRKLGVDLFDASKIKTIWGDFLRSL
jgi:hypothetical protein